jgi:hypothetical protein
MTDELSQKIDAQEKKLDAIYASVEKTRKYILWTVIGTVVVFVLPLIGLIFVIPWFLSTMSAAYNIN